MLQWLRDNKEWVFGGCGITAIAGLWALIRWLWRGGFEREKGKAEQISKNNTGGVSASSIEGLSSTRAEIDVDVLKAKTHILFIDDDHKFKVVDILKSSG
jgi:hypothetical protein